MSEFLLLVIAAVIYLDLSTLREFSEEHYLNTFFGVKKVVIAFSVLAVLLAVLTDNGIDNAILYCLFFGPAFYLFKRDRWITVIKQEPELTKGFTQRTVLKLDAYWLILMWCAALVLVSVLYKSFKMFTATPTSQIEAVLVSALGSSAILYCLIYYLADKMSPKGFWFNIGMDRGVKNVWSVWVIPIVTGIAFASISATILLSRSVQPDTPLNDILKETQSSSALISFLLIAVILAPFIEELTFRGYFYHVFRKVKGKLFALIVISLTFGALHMHQYWGDWAAIFMVFLLGFVLTLMRSVTRSVKPCMVLHYTYNFAVTIIPMIVLLTAHSAYFKYQAMYDHLNYEQKEELLLEAIEQDEKFAVAYNDLAWLYATEGTAGEEALDLISTALEFEPENTMFLDTKAEVLENMEHYAEAVTVRETILELSDSDKVQQKQRQKINELRAKF